MFLVNKYTACYFRIIEQRKILREPQGYSENHRIVPKSLGGNRAKSNMIRLTAKDSRKGSPEDIPRLEVPATKYQQIIRTLSLNDIQH